MGFWAVLDPEEVTKFIAAGKVALAPILVIAGVGVGVGVVFDFFGGSCICWWLF